MKFTHKTHFLMWRIGLSPLILDGYPVFQWETSLEHLFLLSSLSSRNLSLMLSSSLLFLSTASGARLSMDELGLTLLKSMNTYSVSLLSHQTFRHHLPICNTSSKNCGTIRYPHYPQKLAYVCILILFPVISTILWIPSRYTAGRYPIQK